MSPPNRLPTPDANNLGNVLVDAQSGMFLAADASAVARLNVTSGDLAKLRHNELLPDFSNEQWRDLLDQNDKQTGGFPTKVKIKDGSLLDARLLVTLLSGSNQKYLLLSISSATKQHFDPLHCDALTGLPDRRELARHYEHWIDVVGEPEYSFAVLFMDLEQFKQVNDQHGHAAGDRVLTTLAERWQRCVREGDLVVRYGGDEFVVLLECITNPEEAKPAIARIVAATSKPIEVEGALLKVGVTIGLALSNEHSGDIEQMIIAADRDMYAAKRSP